MPREDTLQVRLCRTRVPQTTRVDSHSGPRAHGVDADSLEAFEEELLRIARLRLENDLRECAARRSASEVRQRACLERNRSEALLAVKSRVHLRIRHLLKNKMRFHGVF